MPKISLCIFILSFLILSGCSTTKEEVKIPETATKEEKSSILEQESELETEAAVAVTTENPGSRFQNRQIEELLRKNITASGCEEFLKELTKAPHVAGSKRNAQLAEYLVNTLRRFGYQVKRHKYEVLLPYPIQVQVEMVEPAAFSASLREEPLELDLDTQARSVFPYNAYSPDCDLTAPVIYVNYGRREDFERLAAMGIDCRGKIAMARYGHIFRGTKVKLATEFGAVGMILYSDPADDGFVQGDAYPHGKFRPATAVERGSILDISAYPGDPGTPGKPSLPGSEQLDFDQMKSLPNLPTTCLSQADARPLLENMGGKSVPDGWQGGVPITYHLGNEQKVQVRMYLEMDYSLRQIENITASLTGLRCPDEVIIIGNHRDAWVHGAVDPGSGTAALLEAARVLADANANGQGLDRTIRFAFWDAEEFGMIGSTEYGEQFAEELTRDCVAYLNVDAAVSGPDLRIAGVPTLYNFCEDVLSSIADPLQGKTLADTMRQADGNIPFGVLGSGSDYTVFLDHLGIDCLDVSSSGPYGVYHSGYDTYVYMKRFGDPGFKHHKKVAEVIATMVNRLASARTLPFDFSRLGEYLVGTKERMEKKHSNLDLSELGELAQSMVALGATINDELAKVSEQPISLESRLAINGRIFRAGRKLLIAGGLPSRPWYRHSLFAPDPDHGYGTMDLPTISGPLAMKDKKAAQDGASKLIGALRDYLNELDALRQFLERVSQ